ncbi:MAG: hypothetical protein R2709_10525 [Marmoricola sp.]
MTASSPGSLIRSSACASTTNTTPVAEHSSTSACDSSPTHTTPRPTPATGTGDSRTKCSTRGWRSRRKNSYVRASLVGDALDVPWITWLADLEPADESADVSSLLLLRHMLTVGGIDEQRAVPLIQLPVEEARGAILKLSRAGVGGRQLLTTIEGTPDGTAPVWRLGSSALEGLLSLDRAAGHMRTMPTCTEIAMSYANARGRISSTELGSLVGASGTNVGAILKALAADGVLTPSTPTGRGRGFYYRWASTDP